MQRSLVLVMASILVVSLIAGCSGGEKSDGTITISVEPVETIDTSVNQVFTITRGFDLNSGYMWREDYDESMLELVETAIESDKQKDGKIVLSQVFRFKAIKKGETVITLAYARPTLQELMIANQEVILVNIE